MPDKAQRASRSFSRSKPMAEVTLILENCRSREIVVPTRVGRILRDEGIALPQEEDAAFDAIHALEGRVCFTMLTELLSRRDHGTQEAREKLALYGFRLQEIDAALARATEMRFLDDARFASYFIEERKRRGWGRRKIEMELKRKGIDPEEIEGFPEAFFDEDDEAVRARAILSRKSIPEGRAFDKLVRHLMSKGFSYSVAADAVKERLSDEQ